MTELSEGYNVRSQPAVADFQNTGRRQRIKACKWPFREGKVDSPPDSTQRNAALSTPSF